MNGERRVLNNSFVCGPVPELELGGKKLSDVLMQAASHITQQAMALVCLQSNSVKLETQKGPPKRLMTRALMLRRAYTGAAAIFGHPLGKKTQVRACIVGDPAAGWITHDYRIVGEIESHKN